MINDIHKNIQDLIDSIKDKLSSKISENDFGYELDCEYPSDASVKQLSLELALEYYSDLDTPTILGIAKQYYNFLTSK